MSTYDIGSLIVAGIIVYLVAGILLSCITFDSYYEEHQEKKLVATILFWPIIVVAVIVVLFVLAILSAFKGLYFIVRDTIEENKYE